MTYSRRLNSLCQAALRWSLEELEPRRLMSVTLTPDGALYIKGTQSNDVLEVYYAHETQNDPLKLYVSFNGYGYAAVLDPAKVREIHIDGGDGNDYISVGSEWAPSECPTTLNGGAGDDTVIGSHGNDLLLGGAGADRIGGTPEMLDHHDPLPDDTQFVGRDTLIPGTGNDVMDGEADSTHFTGEGRRLACISQLVDGIITVDGDGGNDRLDVYIGAERDQRWLTIENWWGVNDYKSGNSGPDILLGRDTLREIHVYRNGGSIKFNIAPEIADLGIKVILMDPPAPPAPPADNNVAPPADPTTTTTDTSTPADTTDDSTQIVYAAPRAPTVAPATFSTSPLLVSDKDDLWDA